jgi:hypothetical protein
VVAEVAARLAIEYKAADAITCNRIETGTLEHALESSVVQAFFDAWRTDPILRDAHEHAVAWGMAHPDEAG